MLFGEDRTRLKSIIGNPKFKKPVIPEKGTPISIYVSKKDRRKLDRLSRPEFVGSRPFIGYYCGRGSALVERRGK